MVRNRDVPDLLDRFMQESGKTQRWVTVSELRAYFNLDELSAPAISGFLQRIFQGSFSSCPWRVERIERVPVRKNQCRVVKRYLVSRRPSTRRKSPAAPDDRLPGAGTRNIFTDYDAVTYLNRVLLKSGSRGDP